MLRDDFVFNGRCSVCYDETAVAETPVGRFICRRCANTATLLIEHAISIGNLDMAQALLDDWGVFSVHARLAAEKGLAEEDWSDDIAILRALGEIY